MQTAPAREAQDQHPCQLVRSMELNDLEQVMEVEQQSFPSTWPPTAFRREIQHNRLARYLVAVERRDDATGGDRLPRPESGVAGLGRFLGELRQILHGDGGLPPPDERRELVVGFVGIWLLADEAHIVTIAVRDSHRGRGIGELLLIAAIETALRERQSVVTLECRVSNTVALRLYEKYGFQQVGLRPRYYSDNREDAYIVSVDGIEATSYRRLFEQRRNEHRERCGDYELSL
ncbi:MAG: ribosomal-protein-alanine N-acetyltransferase [Chloroflexi bacterium RBG_16_64_32]|nr:MAG: ribosomal-protein-alanine N-acetyltransferase [Chloroflexi bacterium RBG_16_64_32]